MRATLMYGAHDVRVEAVPDARLVEPTDALVRVTRSRRWLTATDPAAGSTARAPKGRQRRTQSRRAP